MSGKLRKAVTNLFRKIKEYILNSIKNASKKPVRNCDVGDACEQADRFIKFCRRHRVGCGLSQHNKTTCPVCSGSNVDCDYCAIFWSQMPYKEEGDK